MKIAMLCYSPASVNIFNALSSKIPDFISKFTMFFPNLEVLEFHSNLLNKSTKIEFKIGDIALQASNYDIVLYGTGSGDTIEYKLPSRVRMVTRNTPTVAINDIFWNETPSRLLERYEDKPDYVIVTTKREKELLCLHNEHFTDNNTIHIGNPHFERLKTLKYLEDRVKGSISFISQCCTGGSYNEPTGLLSRIGLLELLELKKRGKIKELHVYKHPRENNLFYKEYGIEIEKTNELSDMLRSEIIISGGSTPHFESMILGKKTILIGKESIEDRLEKENWEENIILPTDNIIENIYSFLAEVQNGKTIT